MMLDYKKEGLNDVYTFKAEGFVKVESKEGVRGYERIEAGGKLVFKDGELIEADFVVSGNSAYRFGNYEVELPKGSKVVLKDNLAVITLPVGSKVKTPKEIASSKDRKMDFEFKTEQGKGLILENGEAFAGAVVDGARVEASLFFDGAKELFYVDGYVQIGKLDVGTADITRTYKTYLFFDGKEHPEFSDAYISLNGKFFTGSPKGKLAPPVEFLEGNKYVDIAGKQKFVIQSRGGQIGVENRKAEGMIPKVTTKGYFYVIVGNKAVGYVDGMKEPFFYSSPKINKQELSGFTTTPMQLVTLNENGERLIKNWDVIIDDKNHIEPVAVQYADKVAAIGQKGNPVSTKTKFYELSEGDRKKFVGLTSKLQLDYLKSGKSFGDFLEGMKNLIAMEKQESINLHCKIL